MTYRSTFILGLMVLLFAVPHSTFAATYENRDACRYAAENGEFPGDAALDCYSCAQDGGVFEYFFGDAAGECLAEAPGAPAPSEQNYDADRNYALSLGYTPTSTRCNFSDGSVLCPSSMLCVEYASDQGFCYARSGGGDDGRLVNLLTVGSVQELFARILQLLVQVGSILLVLALMLAGFRFVTAQGNPEAIAKAKTALMWVVIGGLLLLGAQALSLVLEGAITSL